MAQIWLAIPDKGCCTHGRFDVSRLRTSCQLIWSEGRDPVCQLKQTANLFIMILERLFATKTLLSLYSVPSCALSCSLKQARARLTHMHILSSISAHHFPVSFNSFFSPTWHMLILFLAASWVHCHGALSVQSPSLGPLTRGTAAFKMRKGERKERKCHNFLLGLQDPLMFQCQCFIPFSFHSSLYRPYPLYFLFQLLFPNLSNRS